MGRIASHLGKSRYSVEVLYDADESIQETLDYLDGKIIVLNTAYFDMEVVIAGTYSAYLSKLNKVDDLINLLNSHEVGSNGWGSTIKLINKATGDALIAKDIYVKDLYLQAEIYAEKTAKAIERTTLGNKIAKYVNPIMSLWCAVVSDGTNGTHLYQTGDMVELWVVAYNAGDNQEAIYVIPPITVTANITIPNAKLALPAGYSSLDAACMSFWNVAMEGGFARWTPRITVGVTIFKDSSLNYACLQNDSGLPKIVSDFLYVESLPSEHRFTEGETVSFKRKDIPFYHIKQEDCTHGDEVLVYMVNDVPTAVIGFLEKPKRQPKPEDTDGWAATGGPYGHTFTYGTNIHPIIDTFCGLDWTEPDTIYDYDIVSDELLCKQTEGSLGINIMTINHTVVCDGAANSGRISQSTNWGIAWESTMTQKETTWVSTRHKNNSHPTAQPSYFGGCDEFSPTDQDNGWMVGGLIHYSMTAYLPGIGALKVLDSYEYWHPTYNGFTFEKDHLFYHLESVDYTSPTEYTLVWTPSN